jgi:benzoate membrane transport protein
MSLATIGSGIVAWFFGATKALIILNIANQYKLPTNITISWIFILYLTAGVAGVYLVLKYKQPFGMAWPIPAAVFIGSALSHMAMPDICGAFLMTGILVIILGYSGLVTRVMNLVPVPIMMGMVAGVFVPFGLKVIQPAVSIPWIWAVTFGVFIIFNLMRGVSAKFPATLAALIVGTIFITVIGKSQWSGMVFSWPQVVMPGLKFTLPGFLELTIPMTLTIVGVNNTQAFGVLLVEDYIPPVASITTLGGIATLINSFFCGSPGSVAGPTTAILVDPASGKKEGRYAAALVNAVLWVVLAFCASAVVAITKVVPLPFIEMMAGLAMLGVLVGAFSVAFGSKHRIGALFAFLVAVSGVMILNIGAPFWSLVFGVIISHLFEPGDFAKDGKKVAENVRFR